MQLLITRQQILERTPINGNIDNDKLTPHQITAQDIEVQSVLGSPLYNRILADLENNNLAGEYLSLYNTYIVPMAAHYTAADFYLFHAYEVANGGIFRHQSENSFTPDLKEIQNLSREQSNKATFYRNRLTDYLGYFSSSFPEYLESAEPGLSPNSAPPNNQWNLR